MAQTGLIATLARRIGGVRAGSSGYIWQLAPAGLRILGGRPGGRSFEPSARFLDHCLAVAEAHLTAIELQREGQIADLSVQCEPACWRTFPGLGGEPRVLKPDLFMSATSHDERGRYEDLWFVEIDRGSESLATLLGKCAVYEAYRASGIEQQRHGTFPLVVWQLPALERQLRLTRAIQRSRSLTPQLYRCVTPDELVELFAGGAA